MKILIIRDTAPAHGDKDLIKRINYFVNSDELFFDTSSGELSVLLLKCAVIKYNLKMSNFSVSNGRDIINLEKYTNNFSDIINNSLENILSCTRNVKGNELVTSKKKTLLIKDNATAYGDNKLIKHIKDFVNNGDSIFETSNRELSRLLLRCYIRENNFDKSNFFVSDGTDTIGADDLPLYFSSLINDSIETIYFNSK